MSHLKLVRRPVAVCDKCHRKVSPENDASVLDLKTGIALLHNPRHLLPVIVEDVVVCEGSPSRAQYIDGQRRDKRSRYQYRTEYEDQFRAAYAEMQREVATKASR